MSVQQKIVLKMVGEVQLEEFARAHKALQKVKNEMHSTRSAFVTGFKKMGVAAGKLKDIMKTVIHQVKQFAIMYSALAAAGVAAFTQLNSTIAKVGIVTGYTTDQIKEMQYAVMEMSSKSIFSANDLAKSMYEVGAMIDGISPEALQQVVDVSQKLAVAAGFDDATAAAELLVTTYRQFGKEYADITSASAALSAILMNAANSTALSIGDIGVAMQYVGGTAASLDQEFENVIAALGILRNAGMNASVASTSLNMVFTNLARPSAEAADWMNRLGISVTNTDGSFKEITEIAKEVTKAFGENQDMFKDQAEMMAVLQEMFGVRGARAMTIFMEAIEKDESAMDDLAESFVDTEEGLADLEEAFENYMGTPSAILKTMWNQVKNLATVLGEAFLVDPKTGGMNDFVVAIQELLASEGMQDFMRDLGEVMAKIADNIVPLLVTAFEKLGPLLIDVLELVAQLVGGEGFQAFMNAVIDFVAIAGKQLIVLFARLMPALDRIFMALSKLMPIFRLWLLLVMQLYPFIIMIVYGVEILAEILVGLMPIIKFLGEIIGRFLIVPLTIVGILITAVVQFVGWLMGMIDDLGLSPVFKEKFGFDPGEVGERLTAMGDMMGDAMTGLGTREWEAEGAVEDDYSDYKGGDDYDFGTPAQTGGGGGQTNNTEINITVEGDATEETVDEMADRYEETEMWAGPPH